MRAQYYVPLSNYWPDVPYYVVGPFLSRADAEEWVQRILTDPFVNSSLHISRDIRRNWFVEPPCSARRVRARFGRRVLRRALGVVDPSLDAVLRAIDLVNSMNP